MKASFYQPQIQRVLGMLERGVGDQYDEISTLNPKDYLDDALLAEEKELFRRLPLIIGHASELAKAGDFIVRELDGRSYLITRDKHGKLHAFLNYCQHRGSKLEHQSEGCKGRFTCPYHAWTYANTGELIGVPRVDLFPNLEKSKKGLKRVEIEEAYGLLWLIQDSRNPTTIAEYLGGLVPEFESLKLADMHLYFDQTRTLNANWKFPLFAFLESYHIAALHKDSIASFFHGNIAHSEEFGLHYRSFVPRTNADELATASLDQVNLNDYITPTNIIFPNVCMIGHPTSLSIIAMFPGETPGTSSWRHMLLTPHEPKTDAEQAHYKKTIAVLDKLTYENEDFWISEQIQEGINAGAIDELMLGANEHLIKEFDEKVRRECKSV